MLSWKSLLKGFVESRFVEPVFFQILSFNFESLYYDQDRGNLLIELDTAKRHHWVHHCLLIPYRKNFVGRLIEGILETKFFAVFQKFSVNFMSLILAQSCPNVWSWYGSNQRLFLFEFFRFFSFSSWCQCFLTNLTVEKLGNQFFFFFCFRTCHVWRTTYLNRRLIKYQNLHIFCERRWHSVSYGIF